MQNLALQLRRAGLQKQLVSVNEQIASVNTSKRDRAFARLATAFQRGNSDLFMTETDKERAKEAKAELGLSDLRFCDLREIVRIHQKSLGTVISELDERRKALGKASGKLGRLIRKMERPIPKIVGPLPASWFLTPAQARHVGGSGKVRQNKQPEKPGKNLKASQRQQQVTVMRTHT